MRFFAIVIALWSTTAHATYFKYAEWQRMSPASRAAYIAEAYDSLVSFVSDESDLSTNKHFTNCVFDRKMTNFELADNVIAYATTRPKMQNSVQVALLNYLIELCGAPQ